MSELTKFEIAGVKFSINCQNPVILLDLPAVYHSFLKKADYSDEEISIDINLKLNNIPEISNPDKIFNTGQSWSMFKDNDDYFLALNPPSLEKQIVWLAHFNPNFKNTTVYCSNMLVSKENGCTKVSNPVCYPLDQLLLMYILAHREGILIHAAGISVKGKGYIFPGKSGAGKSTLSCQFASRNNSDLLSDDRVVVRKIGGKFNVYGTPWSGRARIAENKKFQLSGIFFVHHGEKNKIKEIKPKEAMERLLPVVSIPWYDEKTMSSILLSCENLAYSIPAYEIYFKPDMEVVDFFEKFVSE